MPKKIEKEDKTLPSIHDLATILAGLAASTVGLVQVTRAQKSPLFTRKQIEGGSPIYDLAGAGK